LILRSFNIPFLENFNLGYIIGLIWPLFILIPGINSLRKRINFGGIILTILGASFLLDNFLELYNIEIQALWIFKFFWPALFIYIGFKILNGNRHNNVDFDDYDDFNEHYESYSKDTQSITFNSKTYKFTKEDFSNGIEQLKLNISFGGAEIIVEEGIQVILVGQYTFGGHEFFGKDAGGIQSKIKEVRYKESDEDYYENTLMIQANITFGGLEIRKR
jgi:hypothetical protein